MLPTTQGFAWDGFFRSLQQDIMAFFAVVVVVVILYAISVYMMRRESVTVRTWRNIIATTVLVIAICILLWRAVSFASVNRLPRSDVDRSGVYDQMKSLTR